VLIRWGTIAPVPVTVSRNHLTIANGGPTKLGKGVGFIGSRPFSKTNQFLIDHGLAPIDWSK
jgi:uracil-DNA glycosylase